MLTLTYPSSKRPRVSTPGSNEWAFGSRVYCWDVPTNLRRVRDGGTKARKLLLR